MNQILSSFSLDNTMIIIPDGEDQKNLRNTEKIYNKMLDFNVHRNDLVIAFGGGVIGDLAGFAAATYHRGLKLLHIPTTIISQVDSSIGGKVVVNLRDYKNIIGSFYQPHSVIIDPSFLSTLDKKQVINGLGEIVKYGIIFDKKILDLLQKIFEKKDIQEKGLPGLVEDRDFDEIIYSCCNIKSSVIQADEFDNDYRNLLNFGHTFGHAIEKSTGLKKINHGMAVAIGMILAMDISTRIGFLEKDIKNNIIKLYKILGLPFSIPKIDADIILSAMKSDKKFTSSRNKFILLKGINKPVFHYDLDYGLIRDSIMENMSGD